MIINFSNIGGGSGGGSGMTPSQVQAMINTSITGKADTTAVTEDLADKQDTLVSGTNIKTINNESILGEGNINIQGGSVDTSAIQGYYTATTADDFEGDAKEGDILIVDRYTVDDLPFSDETTGWQWGNIEYWEKVGLPRRVQMTFYENDFEELVGDGELYFKFAIYANYTNSNYGIRYKNHAFQKLVNSPYNPWDEGYEAAWQEWDGTTPVDVSFPTQPQSLGTDENTSDYGFSEPSEIVRLETVYLNEPLRFSERIGWWEQIRNFVQQPQMNSTIDRKIEDLSNNISGELNNKQNYFAWDSGAQPSGIADGTIQVKNNIPQECFKQANKWIDRKGYYTQYFNGTTDITATTGNEGDTYSCQITGTATTHVSASEFHQMLLNTSLFQENTTYIIDVDTTITPSEDFSVVLDITGSEWYYREIGYDGSNRGGWYFYDGGGRDELFENGSYGDFEIPIPSDAQISVTINGTYVNSFTLDYTKTVIQSQDTVVMHEGEWRFPVVSKSVKNIVTLTEGEFALLQTKDEHTIYNVVADE